MPEHEASIPKGTMPVECLGGRQAARGSMTKRALIGAVIVWLTLNLGACKSGGGGGPLIDPNSGRIDASIAIEGPFDPTVQLETGFVIAGTDFMTDQAVAGKVTSTLTSFISGRTVRAVASQLFTGA